MSVTSAILPYTGQEFLDSLNDGREVWIYGERVGKITEHPAFRNTARMIARLYDALHNDHREGKNVLTCPITCVPHPAGRRRCATSGRNTRPAAPRWRMLASRSC